MSAEHNKALVRRMLAEVRNGWTPAVIERFFAPHYRRHLTPNGPHLTAEEQRARASGLRRPSPTPTSRSKTSWPRETAWPIV
jgi:hypothetical protein